MKYAVSHVPNTAHSLRFRVKSAEGGKESFFSISKDLYMIWGKPSEARLKEAMVAYVKKNGWKGEVEMTPKNADRNLTSYIHSMVPVKGAKKS